MPKLAANLTLLFTELPFLDRFQAAAEAGFTAVEFLFPDPYPAAELRARLQANDLQLVLHNLPAGDWEAGERGIACLPGREAEFRAGIRRALAYAEALQVPQLNCLAGIRPPQVSEAAAHATLVENLRFAAAALAAGGRKLLIEPINTYDIPGFHLSTTRQALALQEQVGSNNLYLQYDIYHMQRMEGELTATLQRHLPRIAHVQLADNPGRHEPGTGEIHWPHLLRALDTMGYRGWVGCEYKPRNGTVAGLGWRRELGL